MLVLYQTVTTNGIIHQSQNRKLTITYLLQQLKQNTGKLDNAANVVPLTDKKLLFIVALTFEYCKGADGVGKASVAAET